MTGHQDLSTHPHGPNAYGTPSASPEARPEGGSDSTQGASPPAKPRETGRYSSAFKKEVLAQVASGRKGRDVCFQYGIPEATLYRWKGAAKKQGRAFPEPASPRPYASGPSPIDEDHRMLVLSIKDRLPNAGLAQVQNQLKRFHGVKISRQMIGRIFTEAGIPLHKTSEAEPSDPANHRFEMTRPNELWAVDFKEMWAGSTKTYGLFVLDDYSRFCVGHAVTDTATADLAIDTVNRAIQRYGRPERILSDRGPQFHAWNGVSQFDAFLADFLIDHTVTKAGHCFTNGKVESLNRTLEAELLTLEEFASVGDAACAITDWIHHYNFHRTHMGIDGLMPADRYFGMVDEAQQAMTSRLKTLGPGLQWLHGLVSEDVGARRAPTVLQLVCRDERLELVVLGRRFRFG